MFTIFLREYVILYCFKEPPLNSKYILSLSYPSVGARLLSGDLISSSDSPLNFCSEILSVLFIFLTYLYIG